MKRWKRAACIGSWILAMAILASCGQVQEGPQGITGIWQVTRTDGHQARYLENLWIETTTGDNVVDRTQSDFLSGSFSSNHLALRFRNDQGTPNETIVTADATRSGNRLINGTYTVRRSSDNFVVDSGTVEGDFVMHPADLRTDFRTGWPGSWDLSADYWNGSSSDIVVTASGGRTTISRAPSNTTPLAISNWWSVTRNGFIVMANVGGRLPDFWSDSVEISQNNALVFVKTAERRLAILRVTNAATGEFEYAYAYGNYAVSTGTRYVQRRRTAGGAEKKIAFLDMKDPDTNVPVALNRMNASTMETDIVPYQGGGYVKVPHQGSPSPWGAEFYSGTSNPNFTLMAGLNADLNPSGGVLPSGNYLLRAKDTQGYEYFGEAYYDNTVTGVPYVDNATMAATWDNGYSLRLSWDKPAGLTTSAFPGASFVVWITTKNGIDNNGDGSADLLYHASIAVNDSGGDTSVSIPSAAFGYLSNFNAGDLVWGVQVRIYRTSPAGLQSEVYRHYSNWNVLPKRPNLVYGSFLQLRTYSDGSQDYMAFTTIDGPMAWNIPLDTGSVTSVSILDNTGTPVPPLSGYPMRYGGPYWQTVSGGSASSPAFGWTSLRGFNVKADVPVGSLPAGVYTIRVASAAGTFDQEVYYPGDQTMPIVRSDTMSSAVNDDGSVTLSWNAPPGFDSSMVFTIVLRSNSPVLNPLWGSDDFLYAGVSYNPASSVYSLRIPKYVADYARKTYSPGMVKWYVQTRKNFLYNGNNANVARGYSVLAAFPY